jgi:hypothetical protein
LDQYGRHGKVQQHFILPQASKQHQFFLDAAAKLPKLLPTPEQKVAWLVTEGDSGAGLTLHHHSLDPYGRHGKVQQHYILPHASKQYQFFLDVTAKLPNFFANPSTKSGMAWHRWGLRSWFDTASSLIGPIWKTWKGSAALHSVACPEFQKSYTNFHS